MKDLDFRVGDKVWDVGYGNGYVKEVIHNVMFNVIVVFNNNNRNIKTKTYTSEGKTYKDSLFRSLYHGHDLKVVGEQIPIREVWVNLWWNSTTGRVVVIGSNNLYETESIARENAIPENQGNLTYLKTIQIEIPHS